MDTYIIPVVAFAVWCAIRWRDKVIDSLPPKLDAAITGFGTAMFFIGAAYPFWKKWDDIWVIGLFFVALVIAIVIYYKAVSKDKKGTQGNDNTLTDKICEFVSKYESKKPSFHGVEKVTYLKNIELHEKKYVAIFNLEILPLINGNGISIPEYKISQRRWNEIRDLVLAHERTIKDKSIPTASPNSQTHTTTSVSLSDQ